MSKILKAFYKQQIAIRNVIAKYRSNVADIDELAQDVFLTGFALESREDIHEPEHLLLRIAKNLALNESVKKINKTSTSLEDSIDLSAYADETQVSPEAKLLGKEKLVIFSEALASLPPDLRRAFVLRRIEGLKFDQIATRLNVSKSTIEKRVAAAMAGCYAYIRSRGIDPAEFGAALQNKSDVKQKNISPLNWNGVNKGHKK
ncbi:RNA polymerase sigma factor [Kordiimonas pumila]|uniref:RNA polymerase sigma factor n=1 Tax=Kordiimonas pumila TaxID=2161677 RepID=A0ABV7CZG8_9PROT|nr:RNA polymerase sigma factor [Kordiimonas pumila]